jgi:uncharacterized protein YqgV (UPF0045/DUF77 family)
MKLTVEISLYPLQTDYRPIIKDFIKQLNTHSELKIVTNAMSTQVTGDYDTLMSILQKTMKHSYTTFGKAVFVVKFIGDELAI